MIDDDEKLAESAGSADPLDHASVEESASTREAIRNRALQAKRENVLPDPSADGSCVDCGDGVEPQRVALGLGRCLSCAEQRERARLRAKRGY